MEDVKRAQDLLDKQLEPGSLWYVGYVTSKEDHVILNILLIKPTTEGFMDLIECKSFYFELRWLEFLSGCIEVVFEKSVVEDL